MATKVKAAKAEGTKATELDVALDANAVRENDLALRVRTRTSAYDPFIQQFQALKSGEAHVVRPKDKAVVADRKQHNNLRNRISALARRAAKTHPKGFTFSTVLTEDGVAVIARKPE